MILQFSDAEMTSRPFSLPRVGPCVRCHFLRENWFCKRFCASASVLALGRKSFFQRVVKLRLLRASEWIPALALLPSCRFPNVWIDGDRAPACFPPVTRRFAGGAKAGIGGGGAAADGRGLDRKRWSKSHGGKDLDVTVVTQNFDDDAGSVPADKKIRGGIADPQIFDAKFIQIQRQTGVCKANLSFSSPHLESETGP